jgi:hypothetical protein
MPLPSKPVDCIRGTQLEPFLPLSLERFLTGFNTATLRESRENKSRDLQNEDPTSGRSICEVLSTKIHHRGSVRTVDPARRILGYRERYYRAVGHRYPRTDDRQRQYG